MYKYYTYDKLKNAHSFKVTQFITHLSLSRPFYSGNLLGPIFCESIKMIIMYFKYVTENLS